MKGLPLAYNKDMQEDKEGVFDSIDTLVGSLTVVASMVSTWKVKAEAMRASAEGGFTNATDAADYLAKKGLPFREAHEVVGKLVRFCIERRKSLLELTLDEFRSFSPLFDQDIVQALSLEEVVNRRNSRGETGDLSIATQLELSKRLLTRSAQWLSSARATIMV
jgi:argininosuccinate lyase